MEVSGTVHEVGPDVKNFKVGDITTKNSSLYMKEVDTNYEDND